MIFSDLGVFFAMLFLIKTVLPKRTISGIGLMIAFAIGALERVGARFTLLCFESRRVSFFVSLTVPCKFSIENGLVWTITFDAFSSLDLTYACYITSLPAVFALGDIWIHVCISNDADESSNIDPSIDEGFGFGAALSIPNINSYYGHIQLQ